MKKYNKVIFLGEDNTRLSPITEVLFRQKLKEAEKDDLLVCSRGIVVLFPEPVNQKLVRISQAYGLDLSEYHAIELKESDLSASNIYTLKEFLGSSGDLKLPLGGSVDEYATIVEIISGLLDLLIEKLYNEDEE